VFRTQCYPGARRGLDARNRFQAKALSDHDESEDSLEHGHPVADTAVRTGAERQIGEGVPSPIRSASRFFREKAGTGG
jgi:hypothetical protein